MAYYFSKKVGLHYNEAITKITDALKEEGFGILTTIDVKETFKKKLDLDFRNYIILGACNPTFAHKVIGMEPNIGVLLPCNIVVQQIEDGLIEVSAVNPLETMAKGMTEEIKEIASEVSSRLQKALDKL